MNLFRWTFPRRLLEGSIRSLVRFPSVLTVATGFITTGVYAITYDLNDSAEWVLTWFVLTFLLGISHQFSATRFDERYN